MFSNFWLVRKKFNLLYCFISSSYFPDVDILVGTVVLCIQNFRILQCKGYKQTASCHILEVRYNYMYETHCSGFIHTTCQIAQQMLQTIIQETGTSWNSPKSRFWHLWIIYLKVISSSKNENALIWMEQNYFSLFGSCSHG